MNDKHYKGLTFKEVIRDIKEGETWISNKYNKEIIRSEKGIYIGNADRKSINHYVGSLYSDETYTLKRKQYSFQEAFEALNNETTIESCVSEKRYRKGSKFIWLQSGKSGLTTYKEFTQSVFSYDEILGKWYINN